MSLTSAFKSSVVGAMISRRLKASSWLAVAIVGFREVLDLAALHHLPIAGPVRLSQFPARAA